MKIKGTEDIKMNNTVVTVGKFDCFHKGHQLILKTASEMKKEDMEQVIFMFDKNPAFVINNINGKFIVAQKERRAVARMYGVDHCIEYPFTDNVRNMLPEEFVKNILVDKLGCKAIVCGDDFMFGKDRSGNCETLKTLGRKYGFDVKIVKRISYKNRIISSSIIREELKKGNLTDVNAMLGRQYAMSGIVKKGAHIGTGMGIPTINLDIPEDKLLPPYGVYITKTLIGEEEYTSITNIGVRPTFHEDNRPYAETNIFDINKDLYGEKATVLFFDFLRPEKKFDSPDSLYEQIDRDILKCRDYFNKNDR